MTWKEGLWPAVCQHFGIDSSLVLGNVREYRLTLHPDLPGEKVFVGEPHRLGSLLTQKPYVCNYSILCCVVL